MKTQKHTSLEEIGKELPFTVPENYFENFASQFEEEIGAGKAVASRRFFKPWMFAAAAVVAGVIVLAPLMNLLKNDQALSSKNENYESYVLSQVDETAMLDYYLNEEPAK